MPHLPDLEASAVFATVAEARSFARAANELGLSKATISKAVARLENRLGGRLFHRTSRRPSHPSELSGHDCLGYSYLPSGNSWQFIGPSGEEHAVTVTGPLRANNADALMPSLRADLGIAVQPEFVVWRDLQEGSLEEVMMDWSAPPIALNIVTPPGGPRPSKVTVLIEFLVRRFSERAAPWAKP